MGAITPIAVISVKLMICMLLKHYQILKNNLFFHLFRISGLDLSVWEYKTIVSALRMPRSVLTELHLVNNTFYSRDDEGAEILIDGLRNCQCKLKTLRLVRVIFFMMLFVIICLNETDFIIIL